MYTKKITAKQQEFCEAVVFKKKSYKEAFLAAYGQGNYKNDVLIRKASKVAKNQKVLAEIARLRDSILKKVKEKELYTREKWLAEAEAVRELALRGEKPNLLAALRAIREKADAAGINIAKSEVEIKGAPEIKVSNQSDLNALKDLDKCCA
ncbi:MAG: hypothetical protein LBJ18_03595 [Rickettsiales bacterium]|jgi:hypothetical protein|nr:hypothetical protein [Rickettsiales bacterium]